MKHLGDITKINGAQVPPVDIITGGSPCQDLSIAGKRAGLAGERSGLFMEQIRIIKEMRDEDRHRRTADDLRHIRPRFMVWENVPGAFTSNGGEDFRAVLEETARIAEPGVNIPRPSDGKWPHAGIIMADGWSIAWRLHDAQYWGVPQRRKRIALVADFAGGGAPKILFECESVPGNTEQSEAAREDTPRNATEGARDTNHDQQAIVASFYPQMKAESTVFRTDDISNTLVNGTNPDFQNGIVSFGIDRAAYNQGQNAQFGFSIDEEKIGAQTAKGPGAVCARSVGTVVRRLTPLECERLQGYPDGWTDIGDWVDSKGKTRKGDSDAPRYKALGNSIALPFWEWMAGRMVKELDTEAPTMASLFDGIGGFPLVFSRHGVAPVWASEIEEFPIAVTKRHFPEREEETKE